MTIASGLRRIAAFLLDYLLISLYIAALTLFTLTLGSGPLQGAFQRMFADPNISQLSAFLLLVLPVILYFAVSENSARQGTWGKRALGLVVVTHNGGRASFWRAFLRALIKFLPWELAHAGIWRIPGWPFAPTGVPPLIVALFALVWVLAAVYLFGLLAGRQRQTLYDRIAGTFVVAKARPAHPSQRDE